ncbi:Primary amine oxidase precursor [Raoultella planticola]|uniref:Primary amine oxidase n=1 Tax=Raoultella planticola TaxID=575 RepID=A0A485D604_RAOPL|nr:Primary amine oxidase precursor [Raoultella planticola]
MMAATAWLPAVKPLDITEPEGKNYTITGDTIHWQNWDFHLRLNSPRRADSLHRDLQRQRAETSGDV